jgi:hypothetical protein
MMDLRFVDDLMMAWQDTEAVPEALWSEMLSTLNAHPATEIKVLVLTLGAAPSPAQQAKLSHVRTHKSLRLAVVSPSIGVRFVASAIALFVRQIQTFTPSELPYACSFLNLSPSQAEAAIAFANEHSFGASR